jgi:adenosylmethionine-8-amino-7-oxononanoate aminotransferase
MNPIDLLERFDPNDDVDALLASTDRILSRYAPKPTPPRDANLEAIAQQAACLEHVIFAGFTHGPAVELCEALKPLLAQPHNSQKTVSEKPQPAAPSVPSPPLERFFFSDNGSTAVEVALKMAYQYWRNRGVEGRHGFLSFQGGYHGDTFGAMAVGAGSAFHTPFLPLCFPVDVLPYPETWEGDDAVEAKETACLQALDRILDDRGQYIAALIVEPLIQGAGGMRACRPSFLNQVIQKVREWGILVIMDEVMTGFGRTGTLVAFSQLDHTPDFLCLSKGVSGGFLPLALTVTTAQIYDAFLGDSAATAFLHGHSYTANPLACAAGLASLKILQRSTTQGALGSLHAAHLKGIDHVRHMCPTVIHPRIVGTIGAFDLPGLSHHHAFVRQQAAAYGLLLRPLGDTLYLMPPYVTTPAELSQAYDAIGRILSFFVEKFLSDHVSSDR